MNKQVDELLKKEMSRKEFLTITGFGIASLLGFSNIIRLFTGKHQQRSLGYGASAYGGGKK